MLEKRTFKQKIMNRNNKALGLSLVLVSMLILFFMVLLPFLGSPILLVLQITLIPIIGYLGTVVLWIFVLGFALWYYLGVNSNWFSKKRTIMLLLIIYLIPEMIALAIISVNLGYSFNEIMPFNEFYKAVALQPYIDIFTNGIEWGKRIQIDTLLVNMGLILPIFMWLLGGWWYLALLLVISFILLLYAIYVTIVNDYSILLSRLAFWSNDKQSLATGAKAVGLDLNLPTEEFELNFNETQITKEQIELIEKVRKNMDTKDYKELSNKIADEKQKLIELRKKIISKIRDNKEKNYESTTSDSHKQEIMASLGYSTYSSLKASIDRNQETAQSKEPFRYTKPETYVEEEKQEENVELINEGFKTTEESYKVEEQSLADAFIEEMLEGFDPTQELPLLQDYEEIFDNERELVEEITKTLETILELEEEKQSLETGEIVIENLDQEVTVEEYLSIPDTISNTEEGQLEIEEPSVIREQQEDETVNAEFSSAEVESDDEEALQILNVTPEVSEETNVVTYEALEEETEELEIEEEQEGRSENWCKPYVLPSTSILTNNSTSFDNSILVEEATNKAKQLNITFDSFGVKANVNSFEIGPTVTTFKVSLEPGIKTTKVTNLEDNLKLTLGAEYIRIIAPIPGTSFIGIEVPNSTKRPVLFKTVYDETPSTNEGIIISIGQDVAGKSLSFDLTKAPHLLVAGSTGSGKSVAINTILSSILLRYKPTDVQLVLVDPKMVEFAPFHGVPHLLAEVITDATNANNALKAMVEEMEERYRKMAAMGAKKIEELNVKLIENGENKLPYIVVVIDELADLMMVAAKEVEESIMRITQKARAAGIHMILATQRPSTEIITGTIKSNIPSRMAFTVASSIDSRTILGQVGAEKLIGMGDMLVSLYGQLPFRGQGAYISNEEVEDIASFTKSQCEASYVIDVNSLIDMNSGLAGSLVSTNDPLYIAARDTVVHYQKASTSMLQRHLNIGYNKAANIIETLEDEGVIGPAKGSKPREVLKAS